MPDFVPIVHRGVVGVSAAAGVTTGLAQDHPLGDRTDQPLVVRRLAGELGIEPGLQPSQRLKTIGEDVGGHEELAQVVDAAAPGRAR